MKNTFECLVASVPADLEKVGECWMCRVDCTYRPGGKGGEVRAYLGEGVKQWGKRDKVLGVRKCKRVEG
jgi:hypothetical protein